MLVGGVKENREEALKKKKKKKGANTFYIESLFGPHRVGLVNLTH